MPKSKLELVRGTLDMMILKALSWGPRHGYAIARWIEDGTEDALEVEEGSLYPALHRMERRGWIKSEWGHSKNNRRARYYRLTGLGRKQLAAETASWMRFVKVVSRLMSAKAAAHA